MAERGGRFADRVVLVTGAARGQGAAEAQRFADEGAAVVLGDVRADELAAVAGMIEAVHPGRAVAVELDVTDEQAWAAAVGTALERHGGLDVVVNNAGVIAQGTSIADLTPEGWRRVLDVNLTGVFLGTRAALPALGDRARRRRATDPGATSAIVNIASAQALLPSAGNAAYAASKWGLRGLTRVSALEAAPLVRVNAVLPGAVDTPMIAASTVDPAILEGLARTVPLGRIGTTDDVAALVCFLASDEAAYCTGGEFPVEGGRTAGAFFGPTRE